MAKGVQQIFTYNQVGTITNLPLPYIHNTHFTSMHTNTHSHAHTHKGQAIIIIFCLWFWIKLFVNGTPWAPWTFLHISGFELNVRHANGALPLAAQSPRYLKMAWKLSVHISLSRLFSKVCHSYQKAKNNRKALEISSTGHVRAPRAGSFTVDHITMVVSAFLKKLPFPLFRITMSDQRFKNHPWEAFFKKVRLSVPA